MGLATMEGRNKALCRTGCIAEADGDLCGGSNGISHSRGVVDSNPETIAEFLRSNAPSVVRIGLETGPTATWLWTELKQLGLPVICIDARHAKAVLKMQINKSDRNDAAGSPASGKLAGSRRCASRISTATRWALLASRALFVKIKRDLENQVRGLLAITAVETTKEAWCEADIYRTAGEIVLLSPKQDAARAQAYFERALAVSRLQQAKSLELRAAMSLARLWRDQGKVQQALEQLAPVYGWFSEGFETRDLKEAKTLLEELTA